MIFDKGTHQELLGQVRKVESEKVRKILNQLVELGAQVERQNVRRVRVMAKALDELYGEENDPGIEFEQVVSELKREVINEH